MRRLLVSVLVLALLAAGADLAARLVAQRTLAQRVRTAAQLTGTPEVSIRGVPFLAQVIGGRYREVALTATDVPVDDNMTVDRIDALLRGMHLPVSELLGSDIKTVPVESVTASGTVGYATLADAAARQLGGGGLTVQLGQGGPDTVHATVTAELAGNSVTGEAEATARIVDGNLVLGFAKGAFGDLPAPLASRFAGLSAITLPLRLPLSLSATGVTVGSSGVTITAQASDVVLAAG